MGQAAEGDVFPDTPASDKFLGKKWSCRNRLQNRIITTSSGPRFAEGWSVVLIWAGGETRSYMGRDR